MRQPGESPPFTEEEEADNERRRRRRRDRDVKEGRKEVERVEKEEEEEVQKGSAVIQSVAQTTRTIVSGSSIFQLHPETLNITNSSLLRTGSASPVFHFIFS